LIKGYATPEGTQSYARKHGSLTHTDLGGTDLLVSQAGFGCYRTAARIPAHEEALRKALLEGVNLIDTSSNYADGGSEILVGNVLETLISSGAMDRESVVVVSKVGYLQGQNYELSQARKRQGSPFKQLVLYADGLEHCIHPEFLADQLSRSLERLKLATLDCYLLHNPEYYLGWAKRTGRSLTEARWEYYDRIRSAFEHLEKEVEGGRIRCYGISSNTFPASHDDSEFTSVEKVWKIAESISEKHHFRVIQLPMNLFETGGITERNQAGGQSVIEFSRDKKLGILINRPLNAFHADKLIRLADVKPVEQVSEKQLSQQIDDLIRSEDSLSRRVFPELDLEPSIQSQLSELVSVGATLKHHWPGFGTYERWQELREQYFLPRFYGAIQFLSQKKDLSEEVSSKIESHQEKLQTAFRSITSVYQNEAAEKSVRIKEAIASVDKDWAGANTLSQMAVRALRSTPDVTTVLVGMRRANYVEDVLEELSRPINMRDRTESWRKLQRARI
jgi:aryl-alcohol dehydrogenase-like predicted oxidoreductase